MVDPWLARVYDNGSPPPPGRPGRFWARIRALWATPQVRAATWVLLVLLATFAICAIVLAVSLLSQPPPS